MPKSDEFVTVVCILYLSLAKLYSTLVGYVCTYLVLGKMSAQSFQSVTVFQITAYTFLQILFQKVIPVDVH